MKKPKEQRRIKIPIKGAVSFFLGFLLLALIFCGGGESRNIFPLFSLANSQQQHANWHVDFNNDPIPWTLWQSFTTKEALPEQSIYFQTTWTRENTTGLAFKFHDDAQADAFIKENFNGDVYETYKSFPLGVMRADLWRYVILYYYGGIYADIDVDCWRPLKNWFFDLQPGMDDVSPWCSWEECKAVVSQERDNGDFLAQWVRQVVNQIFAVILFPKVHHFRNYLELHLMFI
jgi:Glycosyltransferase sugar-binding region containing DXD motif